MDDAVRYMQPMLMGEELTKDLSVLPPYDPSIRDASTSERLIELSRLYDVYLPSPMTEEIYCKLYLALLRSLQKKQTKTAIMQGNLNRKGISNGIIGGSDSFTILGMSGIVHPLSCDRGAFTDTLILIFISVLMFVSAKTKSKISRVEGSVFIFVYAAYIAYAILRAYM
jgi:hypothetical protein